MTDFAKTVTTGLQTLATDIHAHLEGLRSLRTECLDASIHRRGHESIFIHAFGGTGSNHQRLERAAFEDRVRARTRKLLDLIGEEIPALETLNFGLSFTLETAKAGKTPKMRFALNGTRLSSSFVTLPTVGKRLARIQSLLQHIREPGTRTFLVQEREIFAENGADALAIYAAIEFPEILETEAEVTPEITVSEILHTETLYSATLSRIRSAA